MPDPPLAPSADVVAGKALYDANGCALCHGDNGSGNGPNSAFMPTPPRDYRDPSAYKNGISAEAVAESIATGFPSAGGGMPAFGHLTEEQRLQMAAFVISLQRPDAVHIEISEAWAAESLPGVDNTAVYLNLHNGGTVVDALELVEARAARRASVHESVERDGVASMQRLARLPIEPGATVQLAPGGMHLMLSGLRRQLATGDTVELTLFFSSLTSKKLTIPVRRRDATE